MKHTSKPFGVFGTTLQSPNEYHQGILKKAAFVFTRETTLIEHLKKVSIEGPHIQFAPDATFYINIHDDEKGDRFMKENGLENKKLLRLQTEHPGSICANLRILSKVKCMMTSASMTGPLKLSKPVESRFPTDFAKYGRIMEKLK